MPHLGLGLDVAGVVDMAGPGVRDFAVGTPVAALTFPHAPHAAAGTAAEYVRAGAAETRTTLDGASGFDAVLDTALLNEAALRPVHDHGTYAGVFPGLEPASERGTTVTSAVVVPDGALLREMLALTARGVLEPRRAGTLPLEEAAYAYRAFRDGAHRGRWMLTS